MGIIAAEVGYWLFVGGNLTQIWQVSTGEGNEDGSSRWMGEKRVFETQAPQPAAIGSVRLLMYYWSSHSLELR